MLQVFFFGKGKGTPSWRKLGGDIFFWVGKNIKLKLLCGNYDLSNRPIKYFGKKKDAHPCWNLCWIDMFYCWNCVGVCFYASSHRVGLLFTEGWKWQADILDILRKVRAGTETWVVGHCHFPVSIVNRLLVLVHTITEKLWLTGNNQSLCLWNQPKNTEHTLYLRDELWVIQYVFCLCRFPGSGRPCCALCTKDLFWLPSMAKCQKDMF